MLTTLWTIVASVAAYALPHGNDFVTQLELETSNATAQHKRELEWRVHTAMEGFTFFDNFDFFSEAAVKYVDAPTAWQKKLAFWTDDNKTPGIQTEFWLPLRVGTPRNSVRLHSKNAFGGGLFIFDVRTIPYGCGTWPALWMLGVGNWPFAGEIDIIEGVHSPTFNQMTVHTGPGCVVGPDTSRYTGTKKNDDCDSTGGRPGCSILSTSDVSYGERFNTVGGGVFAVLWDGDGIKMWHWSRAAIPADIGSRAPLPLTWGLPVAAFHASTCDPYKYFQPAIIIMNINLCGDWAGATYSSTPGCPGTCAERVTDPANIQNTVMLVNSILVYQQQGQSNVVQVPAAGFDSSIGAGGPTNPLTRWGATGTGAQNAQPASSTSNAWWAAVALVMGTAVYLS